MAKSELETKPDTSRSDYRRCHATTRRYHDARELTRFAAIWHPFGGPPQDEVLETFGLPLDLYRSRLEHLLDYYSGDQLAIPDELRRTLLASITMTQDSHQNVIGVPRPGK
ncbi:hypothetical protein [Rhodococcus opacus]|uniref:hypothetical protein n=1 Tax=Rhodococcus opacus TaxID=37919 RepID=UPI002476F610|nr:hypothetical protein [Rhodococcus opacus]MDH6291359.1 hypothetical protein [Rhodococcus opacus]